MAPSINEIHVIVTLIITLTCIFIFILQIIAIFVHWKRYPWNRDSAVVLFLIFTVFTTNTLCCILGILMNFGYPHCNMCNSFAIATQLSYTTGRLFTYLFYLQRAKLAQSFRPVIPFYYFNKIFPIFYIIIYAIIISIFLFLSNAQTKTICIFINISIFNISIENWCELNTETSSIYITSGIFIEIFVIIFFTYLFTQPFYYLLKPIDIKPKIKELKNKNDNNTDIRIKSGLLLDFMKNNKLMDNNDDDDDNYEQRKPLFIQQTEIKRILSYNIILSLIGFISSGLTMVLWPWNVNKLWLIPWFDYMINSITTFLMLGRNREFLSKYICCCECSQILWKSMEDCCDWLFCDVGLCKCCITLSIWNIQSNKNKKKKLIIDNYDCSNGSDDFSSTKDFHHNNQTNQHTPNNSMYKFDNNSL